MILVTYLVWFSELNKKGWVGNQNPTFDPAQDAGIKSILLRNTIFWLFP